MVIDEPSEESWKDLAYGLCTESCKFCVEVGKEVSLWSLIK